MGKYRILSIDGGGIRGIIPAIVLQRISSTKGLENFIDSVDFIAGTSTGGLLALGIAHGIELERIRNLYEEKAQVIFDDSWLDDLRDLGKLVGADYDIKGLRKVLKDLFGDTTLGQLKKKVLITAFDLDNEDPDPEKRRWKPKIFHNFPGPGTDRHYPAAKVGLYTSAAPTYFPSVDGYIDGGVYATNPSMCALAQTQDRRYKPNPSMDEIVLLSLGTGMSLQYIKGKRHDWGYVQWAEPLVTLMLEGTADIADYQCRQILAERYHRLAPVFPPGITIDMDGIEDIPFMIDFAESLPLQKTIQWIKKVWF
ncbi:MAG: hypothetical protein D6778_01990 [Nitrospirae bacterium]|nr:MAG: hypothetical protein D6778_01990 [Nitrospirota bacterium]